MRAAAPALLPIFRSRVQGELLALILADPRREWTLKELAELTGAPYPTISTEIRRLDDAAIVTTMAMGRTKIVTANRASPYLGPLTQLTLMSFGPPLVIAEEFANVNSIDQLFIYGSWAARHDGKVGSPPNDVDVMVIGTPDRDEIHDSARRAALRLGREVNVTLRTAEQWASADDGFSRQVKASPQVPLR